MATLPHINYRKQKEEEKRERERERGSNANIMWNLRRLFLGLEATVRYEGRATDKFFFFFFERLGTAINACLNTKLYVWLERLFIGDLFHINNSWVEWLFLDRSSVERGRQVNEDSKLYIKWIISPCLGGLEATIFTILILYPVIMQWIISAIQ